MLLAQLSDLHIREPGRLAYGKLDTAPYLRAAIRHLLNLPQRPDACVITGDLTDFGRPSEYLHLRELLAPLVPMPIYLLPGNHDARAALRTSFADHPWLQASDADAPIQYTQTLHDGVQLIVADTLVPGAPHGALCAERLAWLEARLDECAGQPVLLAMHHPPFKTLIGHMDKIGLLQGASELEALLARHPNVQRVLCGHLHRAITVAFGGTVAATVPSPAHQVCLDLAPGAVSAWTLEPPGFALHAWDGQRIVSHLTYSGEFAGPYPFHEPSGQLID